MTHMTKKVALVVGGASGIGLAIATRLVAEGAIVYLTGRHAEAVANAAREAGQGTQGLVADAGVPEQLEHAIEAVRRAEGKIDALVFNAGISEFAPLENLSADQFDQHFSINVRGAVLALKSAVAIMPIGASVVLIGSVAGQAGVANFSTYAATKAALRSYVRSLTAELAPRGIRINMVSPGPTDTAMFASVPNEVRAAVVSSIPLGRMAQPSEVAAAAAFLLGPDASFIAGAELCVDGGAKQV